MNTEKMNVHKALCELKILDSRIAKEIQDLSSIGVTKKVAQMVGSLKVTDFGEEAKNQYKKVMDLIQRRSAIKQAVVLSNAKTIVTIAGKDYTIAEAIEMKNHGLDGKKVLLKQLTYQLVKGERDVQMGNEKADRDADAYVQTIFGGKENKGNAAEVMAARTAYMESQIVELVDPLHVRTIIKSLDDEISMFTAEVDSVLSVSNANTEIEITY